MSYIKGFLLGMTLQLSLGPVFFAVLHKAITENSREAFKMVLGAAIIDACYIGLSFTGIVLLLQIKALNSAVLAIGASALAYFAIKYFRRAAGSRNTGKNKEIINSDRINEQNRGGSSLTYGLKLTALNPMTIIFWSSTFGALITTGILSGTSESILFATGCVTATVFFLGGVSFLSPFVPFHKLGRIESYFDYFVGIVLIIFSILMFYRFLNSLIH
ncbi:MAG: LysE family transporter [Bacillota bacterium]|nr:LysE family transporter [Bacillota bacterium]